jgi:hypothetical protein
VVATARSLFDIQHPLTARPAAHPTTARGWPSSSQPLSLTYSDQHTTIATMVARANATTHNAPRGPAAMRRDKLRKDRDGDLAMDVTVKGRGGGRVGKASSSTTPKGDLMSRTSKGGILSNATQRAILRSAGAGDVAMKESRVPQSRGLVDLKIGNWTKSKASDRPDQGLSALISWLEKKASTRLSSRVRNVKIKKVCRRQDSCCTSGHRTPRQLATSGPLSFAANLRTTTAIDIQGWRPAGG